MKIGKIFMISKTQARKILDYNLTDILKYVIEINQNRCDNNITLSTFRCESAKLISSAIISVT